MIYAMEYYGNNDYRDYLAHHGVKGMKWGKHLFGLLGGNYRDQYKSYSSQASALRKSLGSANKVASNASSYASSKQKSYESAVNKANYLRGVSKTLSNTSNRYSTAASENRSNRKAAFRTKLIEKGKTSKTLENEIDRRRHKREQDDYRAKLNAKSPYLYDFKTFSETGKKEPIKINRPTSYDSKDRVGVKIKNAHSGLSLHDLPKKIRDANASVYGGAFANKQEYDSHKRAAVKAEKKQQSNSRMKELANKAVGKGYENLANEYEKRLGKASSSINKNVAKAKNNYELASTTSKKARELVNSNNSAIANADKKASEAKSKWEKSIAYRVDTVLKRFTGKLSSVGANIINRGRSIIDRFLRRKKKNS